MNITINVQISSNIKKIDQVNETKTENLIKGDLESAINEIDSLEPKAKLILTNWLGVAKKNVEASKAVSSLQNIAISKLVNVER